MKNEDALRNLSTFLTSRSVSHILVEENDPPHDGQATAIGIEPGPRKEVGRFVSSLQLL